MSLQNRKQIVLSVLALAAVSVMYSSSMSYSNRAAKQIVTIQIPVSEEISVDPVPVQTAAVLASQPVQEEIQNTDQESEVTDLTEIEITQVTPNSVTLQWGEISTDPVAGYKIYRDGEFLANVTDGRVFNNTSGVFPNQTYIYQIKAYNSSGEIIGKSQVSAVTISE